MKAMNCKQLGGACDEVFIADSFDDMAELSKLHCIEMFQQKDAAHLKAMQVMSELMKSPDDINAWFESKRKEFNDLPESE